MDADATALNLLYIQTIAEIKHGWITVEERAADQLTMYRERKDRAGFLTVARTLPEYGFVQFGEVSSSFPVVSDRVPFRGPDCTGCVLGDTDTTDIQLGNHQSGSIHVVLTRALRVDGMSLV